MITKIDTIKKLSVLCLFSIIKFIYQDHRIEYYKIIIFAFNNLEQCSKNTYKNMLTIVYN